MIPPTTDATGRLLPLIGKVRRADYTFVGSGTCQGCGADLRWWSPPGAKPAPFDLDGTTHFATCPDAARFRRPKARKEGKD